MESQVLTVRLCVPRGFCAGVERAILTVEEALSNYGAPVFVRHEIVHNRHVVERLRTMGAVFVEELDEVPVDRPVIFSAHGASARVEDAARKRFALVVDATCPLVSKVHNECRSHVSSGCHVLLIGHAGHPEVEGVLGRMPPGGATLIEHAQDAREVQPRPGPLAHACQTTLSVTDTKEIVGILKERFPDIIGPRKDDICYATTNRQAAVRTAASGVNGFFVVGAENSSNSRRLVETALAAGAERAWLVENAGCLDQADISVHVDRARIIGVTAGASAPEILVEDLLTAMAGRRELRIERVGGGPEDVMFRAPRLPPLVVREQQAQ